MHGFPGSTARVSDQLGLARSLEIWVFKILSQVILVMTPGFLFPPLSQWVVWAGSSKELQTHWSAWAPAGGLFVATEIWDGHQAYAFITSFVCQSTYSGQLKNRRTLFKKFLATLGRKESRFFLFFFPNKTKPDDRNVQNCNSLAIFSKFHCRFSTSVLTVFVNDRTISASLNILFHAEHKDLVTPKILKVLWQKLFPGDREAELYSGTSISFGVKLGINQLPLSVTMNESTSQSQFPHL